MSDIEDASPISQLLLTETQTSKMLSLCPRTLLNLRKAGKISASKIGSRVVYHIDEIRRFASESIGNVIAVGIPQSGMN